MIFKIKYTDVNTIFNRTLNLSKVLNDFGVFFLISFFFTFLLRLRIDLTAVYIVFFSASLLLFVQLLIFFVKLQTIYKNGILEIEDNLNILFNNGSLTLEIFVNEIHTMKLLKDRLFILYSPRGTIMKKSFSIFPFGDLTMLKLKMISELYKPQVIDYVEENQNIIMARKVANVLFVLAMIGTVVHGIQ